MTALLVLLELFLKQSLHCSQHTQDKCEKKMKKAKQKPSKASIKQKHIKPENAT